MKQIYFCGAIRGGREDAQLYAQFIHFLKQFGTVLTEHVGNTELLEEEKYLSEEDIFKRDITWLKQTDCVIAEISTPSLGVGYELCLAEALKVPTLCLFKKQKIASLSAMIKGNSFYLLQGYSNVKEAEAIMTRFLE